MGYPTSLLLHTCTCMTYESQPERLASPYRELRPKRQGALDARTQPLAVAKCDVVALEVFHPQAAALVTMERAVLSRDPHRV